MPTVTDQITAAEDDALSWEGGGFSCFTTTLYLGKDTGWNNSGFRFQLNVPQYAQISAAKVTFTAGEANLSGDTVHVVIQYQDTDNPVDFSGDDFAAFEGRTRSSARVDWDFTTDWVINLQYDSIDFASLIQALVNEAYWSYGDHCVIFFDDDGSDDNAYRRAKDHDATLSVTFENMPRHPAAYNNLAIY